MQAMDKQLIYSQHHCSSKLMLAQVELAQMLILVHGLSLTSILDVVCSSSMQLLEQHLISLS